MRLTYEVPGRPGDRLVLQPGERLDGGNEIVEGGETFAVSDARGRELLAHLHPSVRPAPGEETNPIAVKTRRTPAKPRARKSGAKK